jgi:hypothetical protein
MIVALFVAACHKVAPADTAPAADTAPDCVARVLHVEDLPATATPGDAIPVEIDATPAGCFDLVVVYFQPTGSGPSWTRVTAIDDGDGRRKTTIPGAIVASPGVSVFVQVGTDDVRLCDPATCEQGPYEITVP